MCFGGSKSTNPPPPQPPTTFQHMPNSGKRDMVAREAASMEAKGYTNTANYGSELGAGSPPASTPATTGGM